MDHPQTHVSLRPLAPGDAAVAARLHEAGQPGTLLTRLGQPFLRALYVGLARSEHSLAWVAVRDGRTVGVLVGTGDTGQLYRDVLRRRWLPIGLAVAWGVLRHPSLLGMAWRAARYPSEAEPGGEGIGEFLFIGVDPQERGAGIGSLLLAELVRAARARGLRGLFLTVDASNATAIRFHERHGFVRGRTAELLGRPMHFYQLDLPASD